LPGLGSSLKIPPIALAGSSGWLNKAFQIIRRKFQRPLCEGFCFLIVTVSTATRNTRCLICGGELFKQTPSSRGGGRNRINLSLKLRRDSMFQP
jgi:hypothetical protein